MQAQFVGPVMVDGQMMNLFSFGDFLKDAGNFAKEVQQVGEQMSGEIDKYAPMANALWQAVDKESHDKYAPSVMEGLDQSKNAWGQIGQAGDAAQAGDYASLFNQGRTAATAGGMYIPNLPFNQQQQLQQLGFFDNVKDFGRQVGNVGQKVVNQVTQVVPHAENAWQNIHQSSYDQYGQQVMNAVNQGLMTSDQAFKLLAQIKQQQQLQQLGFGSWVKKTTKKVGNVVNKGANIVNQGANAWQNVHPSSYNNSGAGTYVNGLNQANGLINNNPFFQQQQLLI